MEETTNTYEVTVPEPSPDGTGQAAEVTPVDLSESAGNEEYGEHVDENGNPVEDNDKSTDSSESASNEDAINEALEQGQKEAESVAAVLAAKGISLDDLTTEYERNGELSAATYAKLEKAGYPKVLVDAYCEGQQARYDMWAAHVKDMAGGPEAYAGLMRYAQKTLTQREKDSYDRAVNSGDSQMARLAVDALLYRFERDNPSDGYEYEGSVSSAPAVSGYGSPEEMYQAMEDPRMNSDPSFRHFHEMRIMRTNFLK